MNSHIYICLVQFRWLTNARRVFIHYGALCKYKIWILLALVLVMKHSVQSWSSKRWVRRKIRAHSRWLSQAHDQLGLENQPRHWSAKKSWGSFHLNFYHVCSSLVVLAERHDLSSLKHGTRQGKCYEEKVHLWSLSLTLPCSRVIFIPSVCILIWSIGME